MHVDGENYEVTTYRTDGTYSDCRHPDSVTFTTSLKEDLARRDFTVNAMAYDPISDVLVDHYNGQMDLKNRVIRCVGDANQRFQEDALRMLRAIRFACQKDFNIDFDTEVAITNNSKLIQNVSSERVKVELDKILVSDRVYLGFTTLDSVGLMQYVLPELMDMTYCDQNNINHVYNVWIHTLVALRESEKDLLVRWAVLFHDVGSLRQKLLGLMGSTISTGIL